MENLWEEAGLTPGMRWRWRNGELQRGDVNWLRRGIGGSQGGTPGSLTASKGSRAGGRQTAAGGSYSLHAVLSWTMPGCTAAWPRTLRVKLRRTFGSEFKVGGVGVAGVEGRMTCGHGSIVPASLWLLGPPTIVGPQGPHSVVGLAPGQLVLECSVETEPVPEIEWHRDGVLLQVSTRPGSQGHGLLCLVTLVPDWTVSEVPALP